MKNIDNENRVFPCRWVACRGNQFKCELVKNFRIYGTGKCEQESIDKLLENVQKKYESKFSVLTFINDARSAEQRYYSICGDEKFDVIEDKLINWRKLEVTDYLREIQEYYSGIVCKKCFSSSGERSGKPLKIEYISKKYDGCIGPIGKIRGRYHIIISEELKSLLEMEFPKRFIYSKIICKNREFYELSCKKYVPFVCPENLKPSGWECDVCKRQSFGFYEVGHKFSAYLPFNEVLNNGDVFMAGSEHFPKLIVSSSWWEKHAMQKGLKGFSISEVGLSKKFTLRPRLGML